MQKYFRTNLILSSKSGHFSMVAETENLIKAAKFLLNPAEAKS